MADPIMGGFVAEDIPGGKGRAENRSDPCAFGTFLLGDCSLSSLACLFFVDLIVDSVLSTMLAALRTSPIDECRLEGVSGLKSSGPKVSDIGGSGYSSSV